MLKIYGSHTFNAAKVVLTAEELGLDYKYIHIDIVSNQQKSKEHLQRHPLGKIPVIEENGQYVFESNVICRYLAEANGFTLYSSDPLQKAHIDQWIDLMAHHIGRWLGVCYFHEYIRPNFFNQSADTNAITEAQTFLQTQLPALNQQLLNNRFISGNHFTIADIIAFSYFQTCHNSSITIEPYSHIASWYKEIEQRPSVNKVQTYVTV